MLSEFQVGPQVLSDGVPGAGRAGRSGEQIFQELHGRFYEQNLRGVLFSGGMALTAITNTTYTTGTLGATCTPIVGIYNPSTSPVNCVVLQAILGVVVTAATSTGAGPYVWASSIGNTAVSTGTTPLNLKTLVASGSYAKDMCGIALTAQTNALTVKRGSSLSGGSALNYSFVATAAGPVTIGVGTVENIDGGFIVPPGGILALLATTTPVAHSAVSGIIWEEVAI